MKQGTHLPLSLRWRWKLNQIRKNLFSSFRVQEKSRRPRLCPACGQLVGSTATTCHNCGASLRFSLAAVSRSVSRLMPEASPATYGILTLTVFLYGVSLMATLRANPGAALSGGVFNLGGISGLILQRLGASLPLPFELAQPWRLVTAIFLHGSLLHIGMNMWVLMDVGPLVEEAYGSARYLFIYVAAGIFGFVLSSFRWHSSVGGSGALLGLIGVMIAITSGRRSIGMQALRSNLIRWVIYVAVLGFFVQGIDNAAHAGGFIAGFALGKIIQDRQPADVSERKRAYAMGWLAGLAVLASFAWMVFTYWRGA